MNKRKNIIIALLFFVGFGAFLLFNKPKVPGFEAMHMEAVEEQQEVKEPKAKEPEPIHIGELASNAEVVEYQATPKEPFFNAPCPISSELEKDITTRIMPISFESEKNKRSWASIVEVIEGERTWPQIKAKLRELVMALIKLQGENINKLKGVSEAGDLHELTKTAICDEIALVHHRVKGGLDPLLGQDFTDHQTLELEKHDRVLLEVMYRSCRMACSNAFRYGQSSYTRVAFEPVPADWPPILKGLEIDSHKPNEMVCTFKPKS
jgi:hypothetical protein